MSDESALLRLAVLAGIETRYHDIWGQERSVPRETVEALLATMGMGADTVSAAAELEREIAEARERELCEPMTVVAAEAETIAISIAPPQDCVGGRLEWRLVEESGASRDGAIAIDEMPVADAANRRVLHLPRAPAGYHSLTLRCDTREGEVSVIVAPARCYLPDDIEHRRRVWGLATQLYALRSASNWGIGDFADLARLGEGAAAQGAGVIGVNPLHALFGAEPRHISPYSPSSRLFLNPLYINIEVVPDFTDCGEAQTFAALPEVKQRLGEMRDTVFIDHSAVAALKKLAFAHLYRCFRAGHLGAAPGGALSERGAAFRAFQQAGGRALRRFATFEAIHETALAASPEFSWRSWGVAYRNPNSPEIEAFITAETEAIEYFEYLQWEADRQLGDAARRGREAGLSIGLYRDLAVGVDPNGAEAWSDQDLLVPGATVGAPPDFLNLKGQNWGLTPINPITLRRRGYAPFVASVRANMRHAGALRIDHVMALQRIYWIPRGREPTEGAYVTYPLTDLFRILALESHRHRCAVIGEDLGTVPEGFRERMREANIFSCRVLLFERQADGRFTPPDHYPALAAASVGTHDVATLKGYWTGRDLEWRRSLDLYPTMEQRAAEEANRASGRQMLLDALTGAGVLPPDAVGMIESDFAYFPALTEAVHRFLGRSNARLVMVHIEDILGEVEQVNLPGTLDEHPNWRRKLSILIEDLLKDEAFLRLAQVLNEARAGRSGAGPER